MVKKKILIAIAICVLAGIFILSGKSNDKFLLRGGIELVIDISEIKDTAGVFVANLGGNIVYPIKDGKLLHIKHYMAEPRSSSLLFYPRDTIKKYSQKRLNEISVRTSDYYFFLGQPGSYHFIVKDYVSNSRITDASQYQKEYETLLKREKAFEDNFAGSHIELITKIKESHDKQLATLFSMYKKHHNDAYQIFYTDVILSFIKNNPDSPTALYKLEDYSGYKFMNFNILTGLYNNLSPRIKVLPTARRIYNNIDQTRFSRNYLLGKNAPDFTQRDVSGKEVSLKDFKSRIILLDFWASWCGPCRADNPDLAAIYARYKDKGFEIISISLDSNKKNWVDAIKQDKLAWTHLSDLNLFNNKVVRKYHINSIPANFLIDKEGKVIAKDLRKSELNTLLSKLLKFNNPND